MQPLRLHAITSSAMPLPRHWMLAMMLLGVFAVINTSVVDVLSDAATLRFEPSLASYAATAYANVHASSHVTNLAASARVPRLKPSVCIGEPLIVADPIHTGGKALSETWLAKAVMLPFVICAHVTANAVLMLALPLTSSISFVFAERLDARLNADGHTLGVCPECEIVSNPTFTWLR
jgi:hypothetical protein